MPLLNVNSELFEEYEQNIISILVCSKPDIQKNIFSSLNHKMFYKHLYSRVFKICFQMFKKNEEVNLFTLREKMPREALEIALLAEIYVTNVNYKFFVKKLQARYFDNLSAGAKCLNDLKIIQSEVNSYVDTSDFVSISHNAINLIDDKYKNLKPIYTGYKCIDDKVGTLLGGDFMVLAGAPSMGKTMIMLNFVLNMAKAGLTIDLYSLEMSLEQLQNRIIACEMMIDCGKYRKRALNESEIKMYRYYIEKRLPNYKINVCTNFAVTGERIREKSLKSNADIIVIDYLGLIPSNQKTGYEKASENSRNLKLTALEANKPVIALHQLSRKYDEREDKIPKLSDLRDSGKIEQDADMVCFVHRPYYFDRNENESELQYIVAKNRNGKSNIVIDSLEVNLSYQRVTEKKCA